MEIRSDFNIGKYFFSAVIDIVLIYAIVAFSVIPVGIISGVLFGEIGDSGLMLLAIMDIGIIFYFYFIFLFKRTGQTVGMKLFKLRILSNKNEKISFFTVMVWAIYLIIPIGVLYSILFAIIPPYYTHLEKLTDTKIVEL